MCSNTRGPAIAPALVTWPTRKMGTPLLLARRINVAAHSRTWLTLPAAEVNSSRCTVWIESITAAEGCIWSMCPMMSFRLVSVSTYRSSGRRDRRRARILICCADSSPET